MTAAAILATPQFDSAGAIKSIIDADFLTRGIPCTVEIGEWAPDATGRGGPRVMINFADGSMGEPAGHWQPGLEVRVNETPGSTGPVVATLDPASTITYAISGTPTASGPFVIEIIEGGETGAASTISTALSVDGGATFEDPIPLEDATTVTVYGSTIDLGVNLVATAGDRIAWTQTRATAQLARPMLDWTRGFLLRIHGVAPGTIPTGPAAAAAQRATSFLVANVALAIHRVLAASLRERLRDHWPKRIDGYPAFLYGSVCELSFVLGVPLLDDALGRGVALEMALTTDVGFADGTTSPDATVTLPIP